MVQLIKSPMMKWKLPIDPRWTGFTANMQMLNITLLLLSLIVLCLSPSDKWQIPHVDIGGKILLIAFNIILPFLAVIHQIFQISAQRYGFAKPLVSLLFSITFALAWCVGVLVWLSSLFWGAPQIVRVVFGVFGEVGYIAMLVFSAVAVHRERKRAELVRKGLDKESDILREEAAEMAYVV